MPGTVEKKLADLGITLGTPAAPVANYVGFVRTGNLLVVSGQLCFDGEGKLVLRNDDAVSTVVCVSRPQSRGTLTLRSADPLAPPVIRHQLLAV